MKSFDVHKGFGALFVVLVYLRTSTCSFVSFIITRATGSILGPFNALAVSTHVETPITQNRPGSPSFSPIEIVAQLGKADLTLIESLLKGARIPQVDISFYGSNLPMGAHQLVYRKITLINAFATSYSIAVDASTSVPTTTFMLKFLKRTDTTYQTKPGTQPVAQNTYDLLAKTVST